jgi:hypothetical protein
VNFLYWSSRWTAEIIDNLCIVILGSKLLSWILDNILIRLLHLLWWDLLLHVAHALLDQIAKFSYASWISFWWLIVWLITLYLVSLSLLMSWIVHHYSLSLLLLNITLDFIIPFLQVLQLSSALLVIFI